jgi:hypothetical protein
LRLPLPEIGIERDGADDDDALGDELSPSRTFRSIWLHEPERKVLSARTETAADLLLHRSG